MNRKNKFDVLITKPNLVYVHLKRGENYEINLRTQMRDLYDKDGKALKRHNWIYGHAFQVVTDKHEKYDKEHT